MINKEPLRQRPGGSSWKIFQVNCNRNSNLVDRLFEDYKYGDILLLQEPNWKLPNFPKGHSDWTALYTATPGGMVRAITLVKNALVEAFAIEVDEALTDDNMVTINIQDVSITNLYNWKGGKATDETPLQKWCRLIEAREDDRRRVVAGDFNLHSPTWQQGQRQTVEARQWEEWAEANWFSLVSRPNIPTFHRGSAATVIDLIYASGGLIVEHKEGGDDVLSDHLVQRWKLRFHCAEEALIQAMTAGYNYKRADWDKFREALEFRCTSLLGGLCVDSTAHLDIAVATIEEIIRDCLDYCTERVDIGPRSKRWWTPELREMKKRVGAIRRQARDFPTTENEALCAQANNEYAEAVDQTRTKFWNDWLSSLRGNDIWATLRYLGAAPPRALMPPLLKPDNTKTESFGEKLDLLHEQLFPPAPESAEKSFNISPDGRWPKLRKDELWDAISSQASYKAPGPDQIKTVALQKGWEVEAFRDVLLTCLGACVAQGYHPAPFREGNTVVLPKPGKDRSLPRSYRPITLLNTLGKVLEKVIQKRLAYLVEDKLPAEQYGGRPGYSAPDAVMKLVNDIDENACRKKQSFTSILAIDVKGAFDNVQRDTLLSTLEDMGVPTAAQSWVYHFMHDRKTSLIVDRKLTMPRPLNTGIPQGSPISPLLFLIYTSSLYDVVKKHGGKVIGYIDDITIYVRGTRPNQNVKKLGRILRACHRWARAYSTSFDYGDKLGLLHVGTGLRNVDPLPLPGQRKKRADKQLKLLGIVLDQYMRFNAHVDLIEKKARQRCNALCRLGGVFKGVTGDTLRRLYVGCVRPIMEYGAHIWYHRIAKTNQERLERIQSFALKKTLGAYQGTATLALNNDTGVLPMPIRMRELWKFNAVRLVRQLNPNNPLQEALVRSKEETTLHEMKTWLKSQRKLYQSLYWPRRAPWRKRPVRRVRRFWRRTNKLRRRIKRSACKAWKRAFTSDDRGRHYREINGNTPYLRPSANPLWPTLKSAPRHILSKIVQLRMGKGCFGAYFCNFKISTRQWECQCDNSTLETIDHILTQCERWDASRHLLLAASPDLSLRRLLDTKDGLKAVTEFLLAQPQVLS